MSYSIWAFKSEPRGGRRAGGDWSKDHIKNLSNPKTLGGQSHF